MTEGRCSGVPAHVTNLPKTHRRAARPPVTDQALVLRRFPYRESSLVCHLLTPSHGRVAVLAKGAYRPRSAYSGVLDLFDTLELTWSSGKDLGNLRAGSILTRRAAVCRNLEHYRAGLRVLELGALAARAGHEERTLFREVSSALDTLQGGDADPALTSAVFDLKFLDSLGLAPALLHCAQCGTSVASEPGPRVAFSMPLGGRLCGDCAGESAEPDAPATEMLPIGSLRIAKSLLAAPWADLHRIRLEPKRTRELRGFVRRFLEYHLGTRPRAQGPLAGRAPRPTTSR